MIAADRRHMAQMLEDRMTRSKAERVAAGDEGSDSTHVKTYLIEASIPEDASTTKAGKLVDAILTRALGKSKANGARIERAKRDTVVSVETKAYQKPVLAYIDFTNPRFWLLHSMSDTDVLDRVVSRWTTELPDLDRAWLPTGFLEKCKRFGQLRGLGVNFDTRWVARADGEADAPLRTVSMQLRGAAAQRLFDIVRQPNAAPRETPLSRVTIRLDSGMCVNDVKFDGKITGRGRSFGDHLSLTNQLYERYANKIRNLEKNYAICGKRADRRLTIGGEPVAFKFSVPIRNVETFCEEMFSSGPPFRLWGVPTRMGDDYFSVRAIDLHSGRTLSFEVAPDLIRVYLPVGTCGNAVLRFYANIQQRYDALVEAVTGNGEPLFEF